MTDKDRLVGKALSATELAKIPEAQRFSLRDKPEFSFKGVEELVNSSRAKTFDRLGALLAQQVHLQCPVGPHDDPGLDAGVMWACGLGAAHRVAVQCSQGHWAQYPCAGQNQ